MLLRSSLLLLLFATILSASGSYYTVDYPAGAELKIPVTYTLWVPGNATKIRGIVVHQHGCGTGASRGGETAAYDLHWQTLAAKWDFALLGPSYKQTDDLNCAWWSDVKQGSEAAFLKALEDLSAKSQHPEIARAPWALWGHSGGASWVGGMLLAHPDRIVALWFRSGGIPAQATIPGAAYGVPNVCNTGVKEKTDRFARAWAATEQTCKRLQEGGGLAAFAPDPRTSHECGDSRYLAISFFDAAISMRLGKDGRLKQVNGRKGWRSGADWLPNAHLGGDWQEYVKTGAVSDATPPPAPSAVKADRVDGGVAIQWEAAADFESGSGAFIIQRDGKRIGQTPEKPVGKYGRPLFQTMGYHDTPEKPLPEMRFIDTGVKPGEVHRYNIVTVNSVGIESKPSAPATAN